MKNNILLILAVTIISIGIIIATVLISGAGSDKDENYRSSRTESSTASTTLPEPTEEAQQTTSTTTPPPVTTSAPVESAEQPYDTDMAQNIIATAHSLIGIDFADGGDTPAAGFDNSGFIYYVLRENGYIACPRGVFAQSQMGAALTYDELRPGDLAFFYAEDLITVSFGGIYIGDGIMVACLMPGTQVKEINITSAYYMNHFYRGVSLT